MSGLPAQPGLPAQQAGAPQRAQGPAILPFGAASATSYGGQTQQDLDPMKKPVVQEVVDNARRRINDFIRQTFVGDQREAPIYQPHENIPMLLVVMEAANFTREPKRTHSLRAMKEQMIDVCTSRTVTVLWERSRHEFVPWEIRKVPVKLVLQLMNQVKNYIYSEKIEDTNISIDSNTGRKVVMLKELAPEERVQIAFMPFRDPTQEELNSKTDHSARFNSQVTSVQSPTGGNPVLVNLDPKGQRQQQPAQPQQTPQPQGQVPAPAITQTSHVEGQSPQKTSMAPDKTLKQAPSTPDEAVTDATVSPQTNAAAKGETEAASAGLPTPPPPAEGR